MCFCCCMFSTQSTDFFFPVPLYRTIRPNRTRFTYRHFLVLVRILHESDICTSSGFFGFFFGTLMNVRKTTIELKQLNRLFESQICNCSGLANNSTRGNSVSAILCVCCVLCVRMCMCVSSILLNNFAIGRRRGYSRILACLAGSRGRRRLNHQVRGIEGSLCEEGLCYWVKFGFVLDYYLNFFFLFLKKLSFTVCIMVVSKLRGFLFISVLYSVNNIITCAQGAKFCSRAQEISTSAWTKLSRFLKHPTPKARPVPQILATTSTVSLMACFR